MNTKFFHFRQNNSGGSFEINDRVSENVIIEAQNAEDANRIAQDIVGIYFDGVSRDIDCYCCGDRWYSVSEDDGSDLPSIYDEPALNYKSIWTKYYVLWSYDENGQYTSKKIPYGQKKIKE